MQQHQHYYVNSATSENWAEVGAANDLIVANNREEMFTTLFCGVIDAPSGTVTYCNCGHNPPLVLRRGQRTFELLRACGPPLGIMDGMTYEPREIALAPADRFAALICKITLVEPDSTDARSLTNGDVSKWNG